MAKLTQIKLGNDTYDIGAKWDNISSKPDFDAKYINASGDTMSGSLDFSSSSAWITPYLLAFKNDNLNVTPTYPYTGFYQWGDEWQVNARNADNVYDHNVLSINLVSNVATFGAVPTVNGAPLALQSAVDGKANSSHTHNYAGSSSAGGAANSVKTNLIIKLNGGSTEGTNLFTFNGSTAKTINITPSAIGAATSGHNHDSAYVNVSGDTMTGNLVLKGTNPYIGFANSSGTAKGYAQYIESDDTYALGAGVVNSLVVTNTGSISIPASQTFTPRTTNSGSVGTSSKKWNAMYATTFYGDLSGNASTATKATQDGAGNVITSKYVTLDTAQTISGTKTMTGSLKVAGRYVGGGDDEGIIVGFANNGYAGLCLGGPSEARSVFYFKSDGTKPFWRYNNGSASYDITHPGKSGTIALTSDLGSYADKNHTHASLTTNAGDPNKAIYFSQGQPTDCRQLLHHDVSGYSTYVMYSDTRNDNYSPDDVQKGLTIHLKANGSDGISDGGSYHAVLSAKDWGDYSGGPYWQSTVTANNNMYFRRSTAGTTWGSWQKVLSDNNYSSYALPLTGGTLTGGLTFSGSNGIVTRHIDGENSTFAGDLYLNYGRSAPIHVGSGGSYTISADGSYYSGASAATYNLYNTRSVSGDSHAAALRNEFNNYKTSVGRNRLSTYYSSAYSNGSFYMGYFLSGYDSNPYGGFYVCHYNTPYYVGIQSGSFTQYQLWKAGDSVTGAVWNDYAECRESDTQEAGYVMIENGDDTLSKSTERLQQFAGISSDTWGFSQGETERAHTHIAVAGRVLAHPYRNRNEYKPGDAVCAAPGGTVDIMTEEEIMKYPHRIVGTVSCVPNYEEWGGGNDREPVKVNGRIWIKVK